MLRFPLTVTVYDTTAYAWETFPIDTQTVRSERELSMLEAKYSLAKFYIDYEGKTKETKQPGTNIINVSGGNYAPLIQDTHLRDLDSRPNLYPMYNPNTDEVTTPHKREGVIKKFIKKIPVRLLKVIVYLLIAVSAGLIVAYFVSVFKWH